MPGPVWANPIGITISGNQLFPQPAIDNSETNNSRLTIANISSQNWNYI